MRRFLILTITLLFLGPLCFSCKTKKDAGDARENAEKFASSAELSLVDCANTDSDENGYVSCTWKNTSGQLITGECGTGYVGYGSCNAKPTGGCKLSALPVVAR